MKITDFYTIKYEVHHDFSALADQVVFKCHVPYCEIPDFTNIEPEERTGHLHTVITSSPAQLIIQEKEWVLPIMVDNWRNVVADDSLLDHYCESAALKFRPKVQAHLQILYDRGVIDA